MNNTKYRYIIGIDPGKSTGYAVWDMTKKELIIVSTVLIHKAIENTLFLKKFGKENPIYPPGDVLLRVENPNTWRPYKGISKDDTAKLQGAGSIKRDYTIWKDFALDNDIDFQGVSLQASLKKLSGPQFKQMTGWDQRTSVHARDAGMLCFGY